MSTCCDVDPGVNACGDVDPGVSACGDMDPGVSACGGVDPGVSACGDFDPGVCACSDVGPGVSVCGDVGPGVSVCGDADSEEMLTGDGHPTPEESGGGPARTSGKMLVGHVRELGKGQVDNSGVACGRQMGRSKALSERRPRPEDIRLMPTDASRDTARRSGV